MTQEQQNPYPTCAGFGLRVYHAERAIRKLADEPWANIYSRGFDNCFEAGDGDAVVWALMHKAMQEPDDYPHNHLTRGIQAMFRSTLNGQKYPKGWLDVYYSECDSAPRQLPLF